MLFFEFILVGVLLLSLILVIFILLYPYIKYSWLDKINNLLVLSFPFQGFPSLLGEIANLRLSQVIVTIGIVLVILLYFKKDKQLLTQKINFFFFWVLTFLLASIAGWFYVINVNRFLQFLLGILLVFGAAFLISHFTQDIWYKIKLLVISMLLAGLFGLYQLITDMSGLTRISLLKEGYTKDIFGISRIHSFLAEPLYLAGALFFPIFLVSIWWLINQNLFNLEKLIRHPLLWWLKKPKIVNLVLLIFFGTIFLLTYSKSAFLALGINVCLLLLISIVKYKQWFLVKLVPIGIVSVILILFIASSISADFAKTINEIRLNFVTTLTGESATAVERNSFFEAAMALLPQFSVTGIGSGQFGPQSAFWLRRFYNSEQLVVNNIYLEVWLEHGFISFLLFIGLWFWVVTKNWQQLIQTKDWTNPLIALRLALLLALQSYLIQWFYFSPLYIMPIFILLGLLLALDQQEKPLIKGHQQS